MDNSALQPTTSVEGGSTSDSNVPISTEQINADKFISNKPQSFASVVKETPINNCKFPEREQAIVFDAIANTQKKRLHYRYEIKCFVCKKPGHIASKCTTIEKSITVTAEVHQQMTGDVLINSMNTAQTPENNENVVKEATEVGLPQLDIHIAKTSYSMKRTAPTSPDLDSISIISEEPDVLADDQSKVRSSQTARVC
ncbi:Zinc knuckle [Popillia japonica]|uniref:Zinc knuckle n=1 Tax=Popillia japonica TaxID=7064 RepID=A0AAW1I863_POPJA